MLPSEFIFSQNNLQYYVDCKQRFYLKEIEKLSWPANESEPVRLQEERMNAGTSFHLLCAQFFSGVPEEILRENIASREILHWWDSFLSLGLTPSSEAQPEKAITIPFEKFRLTAHYDLLVKNPNGNYVIYDWKTNGKRPSRQQIQPRMQSLVYPLVLQLFLDQWEYSDNHRPEIEMVYWYPEFPDQPHRFQIDKESLKGMWIELSELINEIANNSASDFILTDDINKCLYCQFRSYCNRGDKPGKFTEELPDVE